MSANSCADSFFASRRDQLVGLAARHALADDDGVGTLFVRREDFQDLPDTCI
jgi:hypothetical protein